MEYQDYIVTHMYGLENDVIINGVNNIINETTKQKLINHDFSETIVKKHKKSLNFSNITFNINRNPESISIEEVQSYVPWYCSFYIYRTKDYEAPCYQVLLCIPEIWIQICDNFNSSPKGIMEYKYNDGKDFDRLGVRINTNYYCITSKDPVPCEEWTHVYFDFDGVNTHSLYINGKKENTNVGNPTNYNHAIARKNTIPIGYSPIEIGYIDDFWLVSGKQLYTEDFNLDGTVNKKIAYDCKYINTTNEHPINLPYKGFEFT